MPSKLLSVMIDDKAGHSADSNARKALVRAVIGAGFGYGAFKLQQHGGDNEFTTYSIGLICTGIYMSSITKLIGALRVKLPSQLGAPRSATILLTALIVTLTGVSIFTLSSVLARYMNTFTNPSGMEILILGASSLVSFLGPFILGAFYFNLMERSLSEAGWNIIATLSLTLPCTLASICVWYGLNLRYGPTIYHLFVS